jgi:Na+/H+ antiporter NhaD/arsenite permease-like protein
MKGGAGGGQPPRRHRHVTVGAGIALAVVILALAAAFLPILFPQSRLGGDATEIAAAAIFVASYLALAIGKVPGLGIDRAGIALVGAALMVAAGALTPEEAYRAIDLETITLLLGVMIVVANLRLSGFFEHSTAWVSRHAGRPAFLLAAIVLASGFFSAFLVNDAICVILTPLVLELTVRLKRPPVPYLLAVAMASNVGSTATITGNPQNILIGSFSQLPYLHFAAALAPVAAIGLVLTIALIALVHRDEFLSRERLPAAAAAAAIRAHRWLALRALLATAAMVALFLAGQPPAKAAIVVAGLLLLTRRLRSRRIYAEIDWSLLLMFAGLFIIVEGARHTLLTPQVMAAVEGWRLDRPPILALVAAALSNLVSNVPAVLLLRPFVENLADRDTAWLTLAMASTLAGNLTLVGSIANLIVAQNAIQRGVHIGFWAYFAVGAPLTLLTIGIGALWLSS